MKSHLILVVLAIGIVACCIGPAAGTQSPVTLSVGAPDAVGTGDSFTVAISIDAPRAVYGVQYTLEYDPQVITVTDVSRGQFLGTNASSVVISRSVDNDAGRVEYAETRSGTTDGRVGEGTVAVLTVKAGDTTGTSALRFTNLKVADAKGQPVTWTVRNDTVAVETSEGSGVNDATEVPDWRRKTTDRVESKLAETSRVRVIVVVSDSESLSPVAQELREEGAGDVTPLGSIHAVSAVVSEKTLRHVAGRTDVVEVRYDEENGIEATSTPSPSERTDGTSSPASATPSDSVNTRQTTTPARTGSAEQTEVGGPGFGFLASVVALALATVTRRRYRR